MLECCKLFGSELCTKFSVLRLLQVGKEVLLCLSVLVVAILLRVHGQFKEFLVILTAVPTIVSHFLAESVERIGDKRMRVVVGKLSFLLLCQFDEFGSNLSRHITALSEDHSPHRVVHHHKSSLTLLDSQQVHKCNILDILREWSNEWWITHARPYVCHLVE